MITDFIYDLSGTLTTLTKEGVINRGDDFVDTIELPGKVTKLGINGSRLVALVSGRLFEAVPRRSGMFNGVQHWTEITR